MQRSKAIEAAEEIWEDLSDRSGFGLECLKDDDPDTYEEIVTRMANAILRKSSNVESKAQAPKVDPWELLRDILTRIEEPVRGVTVGTIRSTESYYAARDALKQHDEEKKHEAKAC